MASLRLTAPAKLNLFLRVVGRRADGYHELQTVFQLLDHGDEVHLALRRDGHIRRRGEGPGVPEEADLALRAARLLREHSGTGLGADVEVVKRIPLGGGLGGGSSDAATVLAGLDLLWGLDLGANALAALGLGLGADVPVFVRGHSAWAEGVGERLASVALGPAWYAIVTPPCAVATGRVFAAPRLTRNSPPLKMVDFLRDGEGRDSRRLDAASLVRHGGNDCEPIARELYPDVDEALRWLSAYSPARLTGTGASVFARVDDAASARAVVAAVPPGWRAFAAAGVDRSPLLAELERAGARG